ncbi:hypothetical protein CTKZ_06780 [Cellulomonas algicola]|uniref:Uncharacterized protein n=1 Tax=Cellulomonas algicola TaxID=2071633 RepID=A0A401UWQ9_9CELL|nr:hypothetical protein CTKZ_06780 [Cellulomonas algicola]
MLTGGRAGRQKPSCGVHDERFATERHEGLRQRVAEARTAAGGREDGGDAHRDAGAG